jgi:hypothetical protein
MFRAMATGIVLAVGMLDFAPSHAAVREDVCRIAAPGPSRRGLFRRRPLRANGNGRLAQSFPANATQEMPPSAAVLEAQSPAVPLLPRQETQVWPQAAALFPAE